MTILFLTFFTMPRYSDFKSVQNDSEKLVTISSSAVSDKEWEPFNQMDEKDSFSLFF